MSASQIDQAGPSVLVTGAFVFVTAASVLVTGTSVLVTWASVLLSVFLVLVKTGASREEVSKLEAGPAVIFDRIIIIIIFWDISLR